MKMFSYIVLAVLVFSFAAGAQTSHTFAKKGIWETGGSIGFSSTTDVTNGESADDSQTDFTLEPYIGYFITDGFELGLIPIFSSSSLGDYSNSTFGIFLAPAYNFMTGSNIIPFIEGRIGYNTSSDDQNVAGEIITVDRSGLSYGARGGIKVELGGNSLLNVGLQYMMITLDPENADERNGYDQFALTAGWTVFFR